jgi:hypothetical protein
MKRTGLCLAITFLCAFSQPAGAAAWDSYDNQRFGYTIDIPPGFSPIAEADNGDGGIAKSPDGRDELRVWGNHLIAGDFSEEIASRVAADIADGWSISYERRGDRAASWSGRRGERILYVRAIKGCGDAAVYFRLEYRRASLAAYDAVVRRLVRSLKSAC